MEELLSCRGISKTFPGVTALDDVSITVSKKEIHAFVGENGAGKSTLINILGGVHQPERGKVFLDGNQIELRTPKEAESLGISVIHQELNLIPVLTVAENVLLAREPVSGNMIAKLFGKISWNRLYHEVEQIFISMGIQIDPKSKVEDLPIAQRQLVEVAKALSVATRLLIMDEPTTALSQEEVDHLFQVMRGLKDKGTSVIFISHRLDEVFAISDRISVLRDGKYVGTLLAKDTSIKEVVSLMVGRTLIASRQREAQRFERTVLSASNLRRGKILKDISFAIHEGEILGIAGLMGSGRTELARAIFGADKIDSGRIAILGESIDIRTPADAIRHGIVLIPEDRKNQGLILNLSVRENISIVILDSLINFLRIRRSEEHRVVEQVIADLRIRTSSQDVQVRNLSGGNQQKTVLGKWLKTKAAIFMFDEPTKGIDVASKVEIHNLIQSLAKNGAGVILISSELQELFSITDRILVMREGELSGEFVTQTATQEDIMMAATVGRRSV